MTEAKAPRPARSRVDPINSAPIPNEKGWITVLKAFNPLGPVAESYAKTLAYRIECKRLEAELERVEIQADVIKDTIDKTFQLKMEELKQRRLELDRFYDTVQEVLSNLHIERMTVLKMAELATAKALANDSAREDRPFFKEMATVLIAQIPTFGDRANESLDRIVQSLPKVDIPDRLLYDGE